MMSVGSIGTGMGMNVRSGTYFVCIVLLGVSIWKTFFREILKKGVIHFEFLR